MAQINLEYFIEKLGNLSQSILQIAEAQKKIIEEMKESISEGEKYVML